jgi:hypothetical protein
MKYLKLVTLLMLALVFASCQSEAGNTEQPTLAPEILADYEALKLVTTQEGMYRLSIEEIGWEQGSVENIAITHKGEPVPYWLETQPSGTDLIFYGQASDSVYTPENAYIIQQNSVSVQTIPAASLKTGNTGVNFVLSTIHSEENLTYAPKVINGDTWHWAKIIAPHSKDIEVNIAAPAREPAKIKIALWGATTAPTSPNHHVQIRFNQEVVGEATWDAQTWYLFETQLPAGLLVDGNNTISIQVTGEVEARIDIVHLDWIEIEYPKPVVQLKSQEIFRLPDEAVQLAGLAEDRAIFEISNPAEISWLEPPAESRDSLILAGDPAARYISVSPDGYLHPQQISPVMTTPVLRTYPGADYVAIGHTSLLEALSPLLAFRSQQGLSTLKVPTAAIYDQFNGGLAEPEAMRQFLKYALENWEIPPRYVLLVGDTSYDFWGYQTPPGSNFLPTFLVRTVFGGETGSDVMMAQVNEDEWPDLAIGRVPARSVQQVETFVSKTLAFEQNSAASEFSADILAIADGQEVSFKNDAQQFIEQFPEAYPTYLIAPEAGAIGTNQTIRTEIETGQLLTAYFGHGSVNMWGKDSLFTIEDSATLENAEQLPIMLNFTCLTGLFTHPTEESLAESLLFNPNGGAVAVLAPTSPTLPGDQTFLSDAFVEAMLQTPTPRLGDITLFAWRAVPTFADSAVDVMRTFLLFGDPALQLPTP